jgi:hypothetical protein
LGTVIVCTCASGTVCFRCCVLQYHILLHEPLECQQASHHRTSFYAPAHSRLCGPSLTSALPHLDFSSIAAGHTLHSTIPTPRRYLLQHRLHFCVVGNHSHCHLPPQGASAAFGGDSDSDEHGDDDDDDAMAALAAKAGGRRSDRAGVNYMMMQEAKKNTLNKKVRVLPSTPRHSRCCSCHRRNHCHCQQQHQQQHSHHNHNTVPTAQPQPQLPPGPSQSPSLVHCDTNRVGANAHILHTLSSHTPFTRSLRLLSSQGASRVGDGRARGCDSVSVRRGVR